MNVSLMKPAALLSLFFACPPAFAFCPSGWLSGDTKTGHLSIAYDGNCPEEKLNIYWLVDTEKTVNSPGNSVVVPFDQECTALKNENGGVQSFSCKSAGVTPLAGATYKLFRTDIPHECAGELAAYKCAAGCSALAPQILTEFAYCSP